LEVGSFFRFLLPDFLHLLWGDRILVGAATGENSEDHASQKDEPRG